MRAARSRSGDAFFGPGRLWLASRVLAADPRARHAATTRRMAHSPLERGEIVARLQREIGWGPWPIALAEQIHGAERAVVGEKETLGLAPGEARTFAGVDALIATVPGVTLAIFTADCVPILFADGEAGIAGAVHAGWRGTLARILPRALAAAFSLGARTERTRLWIGPAISGAAYEVSGDLARRFAAEFPGYAAPAVLGRLVDLPEINRREALACGLRRKNVAAAGLCTVANREDFFSYRAEGAGAGRMAAAIALWPAR